MANFNAVALDFDGTMADTISLHNQARDQAFRMVALETGDDRFANVPQEIHDEAHRHGSNPYTIIGWVLSEAGIVSSQKPETNPVTQYVVDLKKTIYADTMKSGADEVPGAADFVRKTSVRMPGKLAVVTTAHLDSELLPFLNRYKINRHFPPSRLVTQEDVLDRLKPDPKAYEIILDRFNLTDSPEKLLVVEDTKHGIEAANIVGATVAAIATTHEAEEIDGFVGIHRPDLIVGSFSELQSVIFG